MGKPLRRRLKPEARKLEIVEAAERLLQAGGGARVRVEDVVREAGVAKGTFFLYFPTLDDLLETTQPASMLDVGTGSGVLALAALLHGIPTAVGVDIDPGALDVAAENARLNALSERLQLLRGGPEVLDGRWPLVMANVLAAPLMDMAAMLVQRVGHGGELVLSGVHSAVASDVERAYRRLGMRHVRTESRGGWSMLLLRPSW